MYNEPLVLKKFLLRDVALPPRWHWGLIGPFLLLAVAALSVWLLDGFNIGPVNDGWINFSLSEAHPLRGNVTTRVLGALPRALGVVMTDDSFQGWQFVLLLLTLARGLLFFGIMRSLLPESRLFALACGLIGLFHPADNGYFWVDSTGAHFGFVLALASCLCALRHLRSGAWAWLIGMFFFELASSLTYSGYVPLMLALPVGAWILQRTEGLKPSWKYLLRTSVPTIVVVALELVLASQGVGREGHVMDAHLRGLLAGYRHEAVLFAQHNLHLFSGLRRPYVMMAIPVALLAYVVAVSQEQETPPAAPAGRKTPLSYALLALGLVGLAAVCYFPYSLSTVRFGDKRQLLGAGMFLYADLMLAVFVLLPRYLRLPRLYPLLMLLLAGVVVVTGFEKRDIWIKSYRVEEQLLAAIAAAVPHPKPNTVFVVHPSTRRQAKHVLGLGNRREAFTNSLRSLYTDDSIKGVFTDAGDQNLFRFDAKGVMVLHGRHKGNDMEVPYQDMLLIEYSRDDRVKVLGRHWLQRRAPKGTDVSGYAPGTGQRPSRDAAICTMLEPDYRPPYCK